MNDQRKPVQVAASADDADPRRRFLLDLAGCLAGATQLRLALDGILANGNLPARSAHELRVVALAAHDQVIALLTLQSAAAEILGTLDATPGTAETARLH